MTTQSLTKQVFDLQLSQYEASLRNIQAELKLIGKVGQDHASLDDATLRELDETRFMLDMALRRLADAKHLACHV